MIATRPAHTSELLPAERQFLETLRTLGFGRIEHLQIRDGALVLDPPPTVVRELKLGATQWTPVEPKEPEYELKREAADLMHTVAADAQGGGRRG